MGLRSHSIFHNRLEGLIRYQHVGSAWFAELSAFPVIGEGRTKVGAYRSLLTEVRELADKYLARVEWWDAFKLECRERQKRRATSTRTPRQPGRVSTRRRSPNAQV